MIRIGLLLYGCLLPMLVLLSAGCSEPPAARSVEGDIMSLALGNQWVGEIRRSGNSVVRFDTMRVDSVVRSDSIDWYRLVSTAAARWHGGSAPRLAGRELAGGA